MTVEPATELPIQQVAGAFYSHLALEGSILVLSENGGVEESQTLIPVELVSVSEAARIKGKRLIHALLALLLPLIAVGVMGAITGAFDDEAEPNAPLLVVDLVLVAGGFLAFLVLLVSFFRKAKTVRLTVAPSGRAIEFWKDRRHADQIDALLAAIQSKKQSIETSSVDAIDEPVAFVDELSLRRRLVALVSRPSLLSAGSLVLLLTAIPIAWFLLRCIQSCKQPYEYRQALRAHRAKEWDRAAESLMALRHRRPDYLLTYSLLWDVYVRAGWFDDARDLVSQLYAEAPALIKEGHADILRFQRIAARRMERNSDERHGESRPYEGGICE